MTAQHRCRDPQDDCAAQTRLALWSSKSVQVGGAPLFVAYERYNSLCPVTVIFSLSLEKYCVIGILKKPKLLAAESLLSEQEWLERLAQQMGADTARLNQHQCVRMMKGKLF